MNTPILNLFRVPDLRRKIYITVGLLLLVRVGYHIPMAGVDLEYLHQFGQRQGSEAWQTVFGIMNTFSGAAIGSANLFALGIMPYISASIIFSLLVKVIPALERLSKEGMAGQRKINQYTRLATVPLCLVQSQFIYFGYLGNEAGGLSLVRPELYGTFGYWFAATAGFTASAIFIMWLGEQITEYGVGNGASLIIMANIIARLPSNILLFTTQATTDRAEAFEKGMILVLLYCLMVFCVVYITKSQRRIPIQQAKLTRGRRVYGGARHYLPLKVNHAGVMPIIFAAALLIVPSLVGKMPGLGFVDQAFRWGSFWYVVFYCSMIVFFSYFWTGLMFQPEEIANNLKEYGSFIPGIRPGKRTADYLDRIMIRITLAGSVFLALIAVLPEMLALQLNIPGNLTLFLGGTSILIVVGVALDLVDRLNAQLLMRNYEGFLKGSGWARKRA